MTEPATTSALTAALTKLVQQIDLLDDDIAGALGEIFRGETTDVAAAGFIVALRTKGETADELAALVRTMHEHSTRVVVADGAIDTCGTGGDRAGTVNVSTMAALIAAGAGARVVKHGNRAASSACGSADVLEALGVAIDLGPDGVARCVEEAGVGFCFAPRYHPGMRFLGPARRALGVPTTFNFLGPLANPARVRRQAVGVSDERMAARMLGALRELGSERALVFHGDDGLDELTTTTTSTVHQLDGGEVSTFTVDPRDLDMPLVTIDALAGGDAATNAEHVRAVLDGHHGPKRDIAVLNAAAALLVAGIAADLADGVRLATDAVDAGYAAEALESLVRISSEAKAAEPAETG